MKFLQLGLGKWGANHNRILKELGHEVVECEIMDEWNMYNKKYDACIITTSSVNHINLITIANTLKIPIFCEKPVCVKEEHLKILEQVTVPFMSGHQLIFMPEIEEQQLKCNYMFSERSGAIPRDEGAILSLAVHDIAIAHYLFNIDNFDVECTGNKHNAKIFLSISGMLLAEILVQSFANIRLRNLTMICGDEIETISPDNWNRIDLLKLELLEFIDTVKNKRYYNRNNLKFTLDVMKTTFKANKLITQ